MKVLLCVLSIICYSSATLLPSVDSLLAKSHTSKEAAKRAPGYNLHYMPLIPLSPKVTLQSPDSLFRRVYAPTMPASSAYTTSVPSSIVLHPLNLNNNVILSKRVDSLEEVVGKILMIVDNHQEQQDLTTKHLNQFIKILELVSGILGGIAAFAGSAYGIIKLFAKKNDTN